LSIHGSRKGTRSNRPRPQGSRRDNTSRKAIRSEGRNASIDSRLGNLAAYAGYVGALVLIYQTVSGISEQPAFGFTWSPAVLGIALAVATVLIRNEFGLRSRVKVFDEESASHLVVSLAWGILGVVAIAAIMTFPRF
jgi:hypothetical protein